MITSRFTSGDGSSRGDGASDIPRALAEKIIQHRKKLLLAIFLLGLSLRAVDVWRPVDGSLREPWRECDTAGIARNYYREGMNLLYPRIDWRGDGPGYAEMEFPLFPYSIAVLYKVFGYHEVLGRLLAYGLAALALLILFCLVTRLVPDLGEIAACLFVAVSPMLIRTSNALQPEGFMFLFYCLAAYFFFKWLETNTWMTFLLAAVSTSMAILCKASAAHLGLLFSALLFKREGIHSLWNSRPWLFALIALFPAALWYGHAYHFWLKYGNSLGLSNQYHWAGWDLFYDPGFIKGIFNIETLHILMPFGWVLISLAFFERPLGKGTQYVIYWFFAVWMFYLIAARTTSSVWAAYYHIFSIPAAAIAFGAGVNLIARSPISFKALVKVATILMACSATALAIFFLASPGTPAERLARILVGYRDHALWAGLILLLPVLLYAALRQGEGGGRPESKTSPHHRSMAAFGLLCVLGTFAFQFFMTVRDFHPHALREEYACAKEFAPLIANDALIIVLGDVKAHKGYPTAYDDSTFLFWVDRKGFVIPVEDQSLSVVEKLRSRGAKYFIVSKALLFPTKTFETDLIGHYRLVKDCSKAYLLDLNQKADGL